MDYSSLGHCSEYTTSDLEVQVLLEGSGYDDGECSRDDAVGECTYESMDAECTIVYYANEHTSAEAEGLCDGLDGKFTTK